MRDQTIVTEHRSLFRNPVGHSVRWARVRRSPYCLPPRRNEPPAPRLWSHKFYCLGNKGATSVPSAKPMKEALAAAGLGEKCLSTASASSELHQHPEVLTYPPLAECGGGYTLLKRLANFKSLQTIQPPPGGHSAISLAATVGQSRVYIRPLQRDIPLVQQQDNSPQVA